MEFSKPFACVLGVVTLNALNLFLQNHVFATMGRKKYFTSSNLAKSFNEHKDAFPADSQLPKSGYPDDGNGRYSDKLSFEEWFMLNNYMRVWQNLLEFTPMILILILIAGIEFPTWSSCIGLAFLVGRIIYGVGYVKSGPKG